MDLLGSKKSIFALVIALYVAYLDTNTHVDAFFKGGASSSSSSSSRSFYRNNQRVHVNMMAGPQPFNPFTARNRNTNVKWFETDLDRFYSFVENQPLLTAEQEIAYGKALKLWISVEKKRDELYERKALNASLELSSLLEPNVIVEDMEIIGKQDQDQEGAITDDAPTTSTIDTANTYLHDDKTRDEFEIEDSILKSNIKSKSKEVNVEVDVTFDELADIIGCESHTLKKMQKYGELSKSKLVNSNLKLVLAVVSRYRTSGIPNAELIAEGTRGLSKAVLRYDYSKGFRFATYATWYVHQAISEYVRWRKHPAKMPSRYLLLSRKVKAYTSEFRAEFNRTPTTSEIVDALGVTHYDVNKVMTMQQYPTLTNAPINQGTYSSKQDGGRERTYEEMLPSNHKAPLAHSDYKDVRREMEKLMQVNLNEVERDVLRLRLGLDDGRSKPVKEVGKQFKISWKQVRSVEREAITKLLSSEEIDTFVNSFDSVQFTLDDGQKEVGPAKSKSRSSISKVM